MKNRNLFLFLVIICIIAPAIHYFIAGKNYGDTNIRSILVGVQALAGIALLIIYGRKSKEH
jgi:hypothetical protein